jgi:enoyl-CoA hydratase
MTTDPRLTVTVADGIATLTMDDGKANAFDAELLDAIRTTVTAFEGGDAVRAVVLRGRPGILGGGMNLKIIQAGGEPRRRMSEAGGKLLQALHDTPLPLMVGCTGHAVAAAAMLLLLADGRVGIDGDFRIGLNETAAGIQLAPLPIALAQARLLPSQVYAATAGGRLYGPAEAVAVGYLDHAVPAGEFEAALAVEAQRWAALDPAAFRAVKADVRRATSTSIAEILSVQPM